MNQFFINDESWHDGKPCLSGEDFKHAHRSLRLDVDDEIYVVYQNRRYIAKISHVCEKHIYLDIIREEKNSWEIGAEITLFQGLPKGDKADYIIQKNVEIGVEEIVFVEMEHCVAKWKGNRKKSERFQKIAEEAAKQSKRLSIPRCGEVISMNELLVRLRGHFKHIVIAYEDEKQSLLRDFSFSEKIYGPVAVVVGPEGGFSTDEIQELKDVGGLCLSLGPTIMRTETAGIVANTILIQSSIK